MTAINLVETLTQILENKNIINIKTLQPVELPNNIEVCIGHSYGCFVALRSARYLPQLKSLILLAPAITYGNGDTSCGLNENGEWHLDYVIRSRPHTYRIGEKQIWLDMYNGILDRGERHFHRSLKSIIGVVGSEDSYFDKSILNNNFKKIIESHLGNKLLIKLHLVENASHGSVSLLNDVTINMIHELI